MAQLVRGYFDSAIRLFKYGYGMINESRRQAQRHIHVTGSLAPDAGVAMNLVEAFFARMAVQVSLVSHWK